MRARRGVGLMDDGRYAGGGRYANVPGPTGLTDAPVDQQLASLAQASQLIANQDPSAMAGTAMKPELYELYPTLYPPPGSQRFDFGGSVAIPAFGAGDTVVFSFQVPPGWDGAILLVSHNVVGGNFIDGSGDLAWRMLIDGIAVKNYDNILYQMGNLASPRVTEIALRALQTFQYVVNNLTGNVPVTASTIATANGRYWPRQI